MKKNPEILGKSEAILEFKQALSKVAQVNRPVLLLGERGTGKELAAFRLHYLSPRWEKPYFTINCAALSPNLIESELFGYDKGAFTGAYKQRRGRFEAADGGTLFLDEITHLPLEAQAKILRVVEYGQFERVGSYQPVMVDVRIIAATNADIYKLLKEGLFLPDLFDRLSFEVLQLPPLRERHGDAVFLARRFAANMAFELGLQKTPIFSENVLKEIENHHWFGNIRELKNVIERAVYKCENNNIYNLELREELNSNLEKDFSSTLNSKSKSDLIFPFVAGEFDEKIKEYIGNILSQALKKADYNQKKAANNLALSYPRWRSLQKKYIYSKN